MKDRIYKVLLTATALIVLLLAFYLISDAITKYTGFSVNNQELDKTSVCINENDVTLYINSNDVVKELNQYEINEVIDKINIMNCYNNLAYCDNQRIIEYPTWVINDEEIKGKLSDKQIIKYLKC